MQRFLPTNLLGKNEGDVITASYHIRALRYPTWIATTPLTTDDISLSPLYRETHTHDNPHTLFALRLFDFGLEQRVRVRVKQ
jgi:hypothetical protein